MPKVTVFSHVADTSFSKKNYQMTFDAMTDEERKLDGWETSSHSGDPIRFWYRLNHQRQCYEYLAVTRVFPYGVKPHYQESTT